MCRCNKNTLKFPTLSSIYLEIKMIFPVDISSIKNPINLHIHPLFIYNDIKIIVDAFRSILLTNS